MKTILVLHGWPQFNLDNYFLVNFLKSKGYKVIHPILFTRDFVFNKENLEKEILASLGGKTPVLIIGISFGGVVSLAILKKWLEALFIIFLAIEDGVLFFGLSRLIARPRPTPDLIHVDFALNVGGFPSGHVLMITLIFGFLIYLTYIYVRKVWLRVVLTSIFSLIILLMGIARIYSGQHWPSDILGAYILSGIALIATIQLYKRARDLKLPVFLKPLPGRRENRL